MYKRQIQFKALLRRLHELGEQLEMRQQNRRDDASRRVRELLEAERQRLLRTKHTGRRLLKAFPTMSSNRFGDPLEDVYKRQLYGQWLCEAAVFTRSLIHIYDRSAHGPAALAQGHSRQPRRSPRQAPQAM